MFGNKSKADRARDAVADRASVVTSGVGDASSAAQSAASDLRDRALEARERAIEARERALPRLEAAREYAAAAPDRLHDAADALAPRVESARSSLRDDVAPKIAAGLATVVAGASATKASAQDIRDRAPDAYHVLRGDVSVKKPRGARAGKAFLFVGALGVGAAVFSYLRSAKKQDPWAGAAAYTPPSTGRGSSVADSSSKAASAVANQAGDAASTVADQPDDVAWGGSDKADEMSSTISDAADQAADRVDDAPTAGGDDTWESPGELSAADDDHHGHSENGYTGDDSARRKDEGTLS